jgi:hypothetical protein
VCVKVCKRRTSRFSTRCSACPEQERTHATVKLECASTEASLPRREKRIGETRWIKGVAHPGSRGEQEGARDDHNAGEEEDGAR